MYECGALLIVASSGWNSPGLPKIRDIRPLTGGPLYGVIRFTQAGYPEVLMPQPLDSKGESLRLQGVLNPHPQKVADPLFLRGEFFDPRDLVQVKYEMLRRVRVEGASVTEATQAFGFSRPVFYQAQVLYHRAGLPGLIPQRTGPRQAHKLSDLVVDFLLQHRLRDPLLRAPALSELVREHFGLVVHPRSIERALERRRKKVPR
jgi:transposase